MIISISGLKNSGKDLVGNIIQYLAIKNRQYSFEKFVEYTSKHNVWGEDGHYPYMSDWKIKKFADKLKDIVCILLDCSREDLENEEFKDKELDEEWNQYFNAGMNGILYLITKEDYLKNIDSSLVWEEVLTPRKLLQLIGTECGREIIHPNIWVNSLMKNYIAEDHRWDDWTKSRPGESYPNWVITDLRFPNEYKAVQKRKGLHIHLERFKVGDLVTWSDPELDTSAEWEIFECYEDYALIGISGMGNREIESEAEVPYSELSIVKDDLHKSENTELLRESFDENVVYLYNVGSIEELINKVKTIFIYNKLI